MNVGLRLCVAVACLLMSFVGRSRAQASEHLTVGPEGHGQYRTVQEAVDHASSDHGATILIAPGTYHEKVSVKKPNIALVGTGNTPADTVITWGDSAKNSGSTFTSGTITVGGEAFEAENLSIVNTWWQDHTAAEDRSQAVALQMESDHAVIDRVRMISGQDTLFASSHQCRGNLTSVCLADRQFFNDCFVEGNVDYIFGDSKAVFEGCEFHSRPGSGVMVTAQSRHSPLEDSGYFMLHCHITGENQGNNIFLGRPWVDYSTVLFYDTQIDQKLAPQGWQEWGGRLKTATYREYKSHGPGANDGGRIVISPSLSPEAEQQLTPAGVLGGEDHWDPDAEVRRLRLIH
jgi:pectinesterase